MGRHGAGKTAMASHMLEGNDYITDVGVWTSDGVLSASSLNDARSRNIKIVELPGFDEERGEVC